MDPAVLHTADTTPPPAESYTYTRLTDADRVTILALNEKGLMQTAIAERLSRSVSTINDVLQAFAPTVDMAKRKLRASALRMAENIIDNGLPRDHVATLKGIGVLEDVAAQGFTVNIGIADSAVQVVLVAPGDRG